MSGVIVTIDLDWAPEHAIETTLDYFQARGIVPTVFATHHSSRVLASMNELEVGLHPFFDPNSSHGSSIAEVVEHVMQIPHNIPAYRCHRFGSSNCSQKAMAEVGMQLSSNVCTDLEMVDPFRDRFGLIEVPIFLEDGGYLWNKHPLEMNHSLQSMIDSPGVKVLVIHPMHFYVNTPHFDYMVGIKQSLKRDEWNRLSKKELENLRWRGRGIKDFIVELLDTTSNVFSLGKHNLPSIQLQSSSQNV